MTTSLPISADRQLDVDVEVATGLLCASMHVNYLALITNYLFITTKPDAYFGNSKCGDGVFVVQN